MKKNLSSSLLLASVLLLSACGGTSSSLSAGDTELNIAATETIDNTIIPAVNRFQTQAENLVNESQDFCSTNNITADNLAQLQQQWIDTNLAWYEILPYLFGPMINSEVLPTYIFIDNHRQRGNNAHDTIRNNIDNLLASTDDEAYALQLSQLGANSIGLLALEISIFEDAASQSTVPADIVLEFQNSLRKCQLLSDFGTKLLSRANDIQQGWTVNYRETGQSYRELVVNNQLEVVLDDDAGESAIEKITISVQEFYDYLGKRDVTINAAQLSSSIWLALDNSLKSTEELLAGTDSTEISLNMIMTNNRFEQTVLDINSNIETLRTALEEKNTIDTQAAAAILDGNFKREIPEALDITLGLNFSDGD
jgi:predicted lipoprotein